MHWDRPTSSHNAARRRKTLGVESFSIENDCTAIRRIIHTSFWLVQPSCFCTGHSVRYTSAAAILMACSDPATAELACALPYDGIDDVTRYILFVSVDRLLPRPRVFLSAVTPLCRPSPRGEHHLLLFTLAALLISRAAF